MLSPVPHPLLPDYPSFASDVVTATVRRASELTGVSERMIEELKAKKIVRFLRVGKANLVVMSTLLEWLRAEYHRNPEPRDVRLTQLRGIGR